MLQGTPYVYQGDELGMTNVRLNNLSEARDVEIFNAYRLYVEQQKALTHDEMMAGINARGRDNARTPMQWSDAKNAGFTTGEPWIKVNENYPQINAEQQVNDPNSIFNYYKQIIRLRKEYDIITDGRYQLLDADNPHVYTYLRESGRTKLLVLCNFTAETRPADPVAATVEGAKATRLIGNYPAEQSPSDALRAYEARVYLIEA